MLVRPVVEPLLTVKQVAEMLQVSPDFVRQHASGLRRPTIPSIKIGSAVRFQRHKILEFIESLSRFA